MPKISATPLKIMTKSLPSFVEKGLYGLTLSDLSREIGMSKPAILYHFDGPDAVFLGLMDLWAISGTQSTVRSLQPYLGKKPQDVIVGVMQATFEWLDHDEKYARLTNAVILAAQSNRVVAKKLNELFSGGRGRLRELLKMSSRKRTEDQVTTAVVVLHSQIVGALIYEMLSASSKAENRKLRLAQIETFRVFVESYF